ncbi:hypothetical protein [Levilactobacillus spicheri]|uniref:Uncharacterized protein n=2 Tax=Levilactobacillus spicheri TaxID=216463 RepID=A0A0F3RR50_9LACO|nr:hypothetical protein [Levilactobacillus spicheri]KJW12471.1 hypothetical protein VC81_08235 [Levilactobacillus spicheri]KRL48730.1 hypothetical protein FD37_GL001192 [Levilactobacillus spicheri DSM 15429]GEO66409.1 hypothetical protein LSP04_08280 [Levilactobacillus spicheri]
MNRDWLLKILLTLVLIASMGGSSFYKHQKVQQTFKNYSIKKYTVTHTDQVNIAQTPITILHYKQFAEHNRLWSYLTITSPIKQKIKANKFTLYRGEKEAPNIYWDEQIKVNSKTDLTLKKGINKILMYTEFSFSSKDLRLVISNKNGLHYTQKWLGTEF